MSGTAVRFLYMPTRNQYGLAGQTLTAILFRSEGEGNSLYVKKHIDLSAGFEFSKENIDFLNQVCNKDYSIEDGITILSNLSRMNSMRHIHDSVEGFINFCMRFM